MTTPTFERNQGPIIEALRPHIANATGAALEIGSGTGQHIQAFAQAFPALTWTPSDPDALHRKSIDAWSVARNSGVTPARPLDAAGNWPAAIADLAPLSLVIALNVIHIAPAAVLTGILKGAAASLGPEGRLAFYGPFKENGVHTGEGNAIFDARLRADNPAWGLRDIDDISARAGTFGLELLARIVMPANNRLLILKKTAP